MGAGRNMSGNCAGSSVAILPSRSAWRHTPPWPLPRQQWSIDPQS